MSSALIHRGGTESERLYLEDLEFELPGGERAVVRKSVISDDPANQARLADMIARHLGRYGQVALFCRPGYRVLDFPCGSGYAADFLKKFAVLYEGRDIDQVTLQYAQRLYGNASAAFAAGDLTDPGLAVHAYDVIACIEGLEHIPHRHQGRLIDAFHRALKPDGVLVVSSPESKTGQSGPSRDNPDHLWELSRVDFRDLLCRYFSPEKVEFVTHRAYLDPGGLMTCIYGICHKS